MRVAMGEVVDINSDLTTHNLSLSQKISVIFQTLISDSVFLGKQKRFSKKIELEQEDYENLTEYAKKGIVADKEIYELNNRIGYIHMHEWV